MATASEANAAPRKPNGSIRPQAAFKGSARGRVYTPEKIALEPAALEAVRPGRHMFGSEKSQAMV